MAPISARRQLQDQVVEQHGVVIADHSLVSARQQQLQFDPGQLGESAFLLRRFDREAAIEVGDEVLLQIGVGSVVIGDAVMPEFLGSRPWMVPKARSLRPRACGERASI
jgi:hypothetical protein